MALRDYYFIRLRLAAKNFGDFLTKLARNPAGVLGLLILVFFVFLSIAGPSLAPHDPMSINLLERLRPPMWMEGGSAEYILGTDQMGMDLFSRIIAGTRISLMIGVLTVGISILIGAALGMLAGFYRGALDSILSRFADLLLSFPWLIFAIFTMAVIGPGFYNLVFALTFKGWVGFFRLVRGEVLSEKTKEYVEAARALGQNNFTIMLREITPNILNSIIVFGTLRMGFMIIMEASLSFLGLGIQYPEPAWGSMVNIGRDYMLSAWWISTFSGIAILIMVLAINMLGEALRDILDPRLRRIE
ncbi:MAG: peptide ABC transporter permease [Firmicutes bacterium ML8_F2]|nr:MAG: peptide ABC transporter permease [Firmicutes bacterium ML8_F2]